MNHIPDTRSMAKLYHSQGYFQDSKDVYVRMGMKQNETDSVPPEIQTIHKKEPAQVLPSSLEIKIDQWITLLLLRRRTESWEY